MLLDDLHRAVSVGREGRNSLRTLKRGKLTLLRDQSYGRRRSGNKIVQGENLAVLDLLGPRYRERVRCIYIDPPYNNKETYNHYSDDLDHETWIRELCARLDALHSFLREDGSLWISIDDSQVHYLKVVADQVFGRENFISTIVWQQRTTRENRKVFSNNHEYLLLYAKNKRAFSARRNPVDLTDDVTKRYKNPDDDPRGPWQSISANVQAGHATPSQFYELSAPSGRKHSPPTGRCWVYTKDRMAKEIAAKNVWFGKDGNGVPRLKRFLSDAKAGLTPETLWTAQQVGTNDSAKKHLLSIFQDPRVFDTPKPEQLIHRLLKISTDPGDLVLDAYLGSGTTAAVAHKMGRRFIGIEQGEHAITHCVRRLKRVVDGEAGGVSELVRWSGGGGFDVYALQG